jgi:hypothetical protein
MHNATVAEEDRRIWRPDFFGSSLFLVASAFGVLSVSSLILKASPGVVPRGIAWLNMIGSVFFMASAVASYVLRSTAEMLASQVSGAGTLLGALCFLVGASLMFPAWRSAVASAPRSRPVNGPRTERPRQA